MFEGMNTIYQGETLHLFAWVPSAPWNLEENFGFAENINRRHIRSLFWIQKQNLKPPGISYHATLKFLSVVCIFSFSYSINEQLG